MTGLVRKATLLVACSVLLGAAAAQAGTPYAGNCTVQWLNPATALFETANRINLVDHNGAAGDINNSLDSIPRYAKLLITIKDVGGGPVNASNVQLKFNGAYSDLAICTNQQYHAEIVDAVNHIVRNYTNTAGQVTFVVAGTGNASLAVPHPTFSVEVWADTVPLPNIGCGVFDLDHSGATGTAIAAGDLGKFAIDLFPPSLHNQDRSDYDGLGGVTAGDLSVFAAALFAYANHAGCATP